LITTGSSANVVINLPTLADNQDRIIEIIKVDSGTKFVEINPEGTETVRGSTTSIYVIQQNESIKLLGTSSGWALLGDPLRIVSAYIASNGSISRQDGNFLASASLDATGIFYLNWATGAFLDDSVTNVTTSVYSGGNTMTHFAGVYSIDTTRAIIHVRTDAGIAASLGIMVIVTGKK